MNDQQGKEMRNQLNYIIFGLINQPQIWIKHQERLVTNALNYILVGVINQPQVWITQKGENMDDEMVAAEEKEEKVNVRVQGGSSGAVYGLGVIGACIYYINKGTTPQEKAVGFLKALVWPVFLVKGVLEVLDKE
jgi:predicted ATP-dependent protease